MQRRPPRFVRIALLFLASSCGGGDSSSTTNPPVDNTPAAITISPSTPLALMAGATATLTAAVTARDGRVLSGAAVTWSSSNATVATVSNGLVTAVKIGTATITAASGTFSSTLSATVVSGAATQLVLRAQPAETPLGAPLLPQPVVEIRDAGGNVAASSTAAVTVAIATGGGSVNGTVTVSAVAGVATFAGLSVVGTAGVRTLRFTSPGLSSVLSSDFMVAPPAGRFITIDSTNVSASAQQGTNPVNRSVVITSGGSVPLAGATVDPVAYDTGQPTGWLNTILSGVSAQFTLTLSFSAASLPVGTYHATVRINASGATNTPQSVSVALTVTPAVTVTYGSSAEKVRVLDVGNAYTPTLSALINGVGQATSAVTFRSRSTSVVTVDANGRISAVGAGDAWIVASLQNAADSVFVNVTRNTTGPVLRANITTYSVRSGDTVTALITLDPRSTSLGSATVLVGYEAQNSMFFPLGADVPAETPQPVISNPSVGVYRINLSSAIPVNAPVTMLQLRLIARNSGLAGYITLTVSTLTSSSGGDVTSQATSTRYPIIIR